MPGDLFVLCSDGLTGLVQDQDIAEIVATRTDLDAISSELVECANSRGGEDNITVVLVRYEKEAGS
jgi:protein phosphatase